MSNTLIEICAFYKFSAEQIVLKVITSAKSANKTYEKVGFQEYGRLNEYLKNDAVYYDKRSIVLYRPS